MVKCVSPANAVRAAWLAAALLAPAAVALEPEVLARRAGLDPAVVKLAGSIGTNARQLMGADAQGMERLADGITVQVPRDEAAARAEQLRRRLGPGYVVFISQRRQGIDAQPDDLSVIRSYDPYDALRVMNTGGINDQISPRRVIARLRDWDRRYGLQIVGAGHDWVEARVLRPPTDARALAAELAALCPDLISEVQTVERLGAEIRATRTLHLWWD